MLGWIVGIGLASWPLAGYIRLTSMSRKLVDSWRQVDVQLKRRHDLIPSLANAARGSTDPGRDALMSVAMNARAAALTATGPEDAATKEKRLSNALRRFWFAAASEPSLMANAEVTALRVELETAESALGLAAEKYNEVAAAFNFIQRSPGAVLFANALGFSHAESFDMTAGSERPSGSRA